jgi:hypothetical protein
VSGPQTAEPDQGSGNQALSPDRGSGNRALVPGRGSGNRALVPRPESIGPTKLIGLGGVGGIVARYLVTYFASLDCPQRLVLIDGDIFEARNASRMLFSHCGNKASVVRSDLLDLLPDSSLTLTSVEEYVSRENLPRLVHPGDVVLLAVDNHATRKLVGDFCAGLDDICLISGGNDGIGTDGAGQELRGTYGNVQVHLRRGGRDESPRLDAFHPEIAEPRDALPGDASCTEALESVPQILFTNLATASAMLNTFYLNACGALHYPELCFDIGDARMRPIPLPVT